MKKLFAFIPLVLFIVMGAFLYKGLSLDPTHLPSARLDQPFPAFSLQALADEQQTLSQQDILGQPALVNVWATWCPSCKEEHEKLNEIKAMGYTIHGINYKDDRAKAKEWLQIYQDPYRLNIYDPKGLLGIDLGVYGAPETYVIDAKGVIRYRHVGVVDDKSWPALKALVDELQQEVASR
ncbi:MAG: DsbE family thiol:disulfide interchange protein [Pontibacterium sp.]